MAPWGKALDALAEDTGSGLMISLAMVNEIIRYPELARYGNMDLITSTKD